MATEQDRKTGQNAGQNSGKQAPPLRRGLIRSLPSLPQPVGPQGITFSRFALCMGGAVVLAALGWAYFMGYMVGRGDNPREQVEEATSFLRPTHEAQGDKAADAAQQASGSMARSDVNQTAQPGQMNAATGTGQLGQTGQIGQSAQSGQPGQGVQAGQQAMPAPQGPPSFDPHARPQGESLAAWGNQKQVAAPAAPVVPRTGTVQQKGKAQDARKPQPAPAKAQTPAPKGPKYAFTYQMGAFKNKPAAEALLKQMAAKGRKGTVSKSGNVFLVTFHVRGTEDEARSARQALEKQGLGKALLISRRPL